MNIERSLLPSRPVCEAGLAISDDHGKSWRPSRPIIGPALNQPSVVRRKDGVLLAYLGEEAFDLGDNHDEQLTHRIFLSQSRDEGGSWSLAVPTDLPNPNSSLEVLALRDSRWVLIYNDSETDRHTLAWAMSNDEGRSWKWQRHLESTPGGRFHQKPNGGVMTLLKEPVLSASLVRKGPSAVGAVGGNPSF